MSIFGTKGDTFLSKFGLYIIFIVENLVCIMFFRVTGRQETNEAIREVTGRGREEINEREQVTERGRDDPTEFLH